MITDANEATVNVVAVLREELIGTAFSGYFTEPEANTINQRVFDQGMADGLSGNHVRPKGDPRRTTDHARLLDALAGQY